jgi:ATP-dependent RNA helicase HelY
MLPAIYFIFSRKGCDEAVRQCLRDNVRLTSSDERRAIVEHAERRVVDLTSAELEVLGYTDWLEGLRRGVAAHHAGMIPPFKEAVEELFARGLVKAVFATETLALGINMPARSVVIESLMKFTGEKHELITPGQYTQLAGRAGRRGIDVVGHCVVLLQRYVTFDAITRLASTRTYPLQSSFSPSYNMAVNLVRNYDQAEAEHLVNSSFAQFQADRDVVKLEQTREKLHAYLASYRERMQCERGDFEEYRGLGAELEWMEERDEGRRARHRAIELERAVRALRPGDVVEVEGGSRRGRYLVLDISQRRSERRPRVVALSEERSIVRFAVTEFRDPPVAVARVPIPAGFQVRDQRARRKLTHELVSVEIPARREKRARESASEELERLRARLEQHPCHTCPELTRHLHFSERATRLEREIAGIDRRVARRTQTLARRFERVLEVLEHLGYVDGWVLTDKGETLARLYNESDLLVVEALQSDVLDRLDASELAAVVSTLVYETRGPEVEIAGMMPTGRSAKAYRALMRLWGRISREEQSRGLELTREPDPGFAERAHLWAEGEPLEEVLDAEDAPGDFVRSTKQLVDLLRQLEDIGATDELSDKMRAAATALHRSVVAYSSLEVE